MKRTFIALCFIVGLFGCSKSDESATASKGSDAPVASGKGQPAKTPQEAVSKPGEAATIAAVQNIVNARCTKCHGKAGGLDFKDAAGILAAVKPGDENSKLLTEISGPTPSMPRGGGPLNPADVELIKTWVKDGAKTN